MISIKTDIRIISKDKRKEDYTREHSARIKDIELLTGLTFLTGFADQFTRAEHITDLQEHLWAKWNWLEDYDELKKIKKNPQCPPGLVYTSFLN